MIFCRFFDGSYPKYGMVEDHHIVEIAPDPFSDFEKINDPIPFYNVRLLAPVQPSKIVAVGINYKKHAQEMKHELPSEPVLFLKPPTTIIGPEDQILYPKMSQQVDYEAELALVIKKTAKNILPEQTADYILGYTCMNDVTARDLQKKDGQWTRAKSFDTFSPLGPWIVTDVDPSQLNIECYLNGELRQNSSTEDMIFSVPQLVSFISQIMTLHPGDVITTGTPSGVGPMQPGDEVIVRIDAIGLLKNTVAE